MYVSVVFGFLSAVSYVDASLFGNVPELNFFDITADREHPDHILRAFKDFVKKFKREYKTSHEKAFRMDQFAKNFNDMQDLNKRTDGRGNGAKFGVNQFADWTHDEFLGSLSRIPPKDHKDVPLFKPISSRNGTKRTKRSVKSIDLREMKIKGRYIMGDVKNQGRCGCCWAFATTAVTEVAYRIHSGRVLPLSDQEVCDCAASEGNPGCIGGDYVQGMKYVSSIGQTSEDDYPYIDGRSNYTDQCIWQKTPRKIESQTLRFFKMDPYNAESDIMDNLQYVNTPVAISFTMGNGFRFYQDGVLEVEDCKTYGSVVWHSGAIVGFGTDTAPNGRRIDYWIVKNSWSEDWGNDGYVKIARGINWCHIEDHPVSADMRPIDYYNKIAK